MLARCQAALLRSVRGAGAHVGVLVVLGVGLVLRIGVEIAYHPALFFSDSWEYVQMAFSGTPVGILPSRPSGYPLLLRILSFPGRDMLAVTVAQHLAGLAVGVLVYRLLLHLRVRRLVAVVAVALVVLDSYALALEQFIMAEAFFTILLVAAFALTIMRRESRRMIVLAGVLLAVACLLRTIGLFALPVWLGYLAVTTRDRRRVLCAVASLIVPLVLYASWHAVETNGSFNVDQSQGWFLYGRVAQFAQCSGVSVPAAERPLCHTTRAERRAWHPGEWVWGRGPAVRMFKGNPDGHISDQRLIVRSDSLLEHFALTMMRAHPGAYADAVISDFAAAFNPSVSPYSDADGVTVTFSARPLTGWIYQKDLRLFLPRYVPRVHWPASLLRRYQRVFHEPSLLLAALALLSLVALVVPRLSLGRLRIERRPEILLLTGSTLAMLAGSAATVGFVTRYMVPAIPVLVCGGAVAGTELVRAVRRYRAEREQPAVGAEPERQEAARDPAVREQPEGPEPAAGAELERLERAEPERLERAARAEPERLEPAVVQEPEGLDPEEQEPEEQESDRAEPEPSPSAV